LGRYQGRDAPRLTPRRMPRYAVIAPNSRVILSEGAFDG
jgi:hypothetical protein